MASRPTMRSSALFVLLVGLWSHWGHAFLTNTLSAFRENGNFQSIRKSNICRVTMMAKAKSDKVQVLLKTNVEGIGKANDVNTGYFNNFLRPKNLATIISDEEVRVKEAKEREILANLKQQAVDSATAIKAMGQLTLKRKVGDNGKIFGTVTHKQIVEEIKAKVGAKAEITTKMKMDVPEIHSLGEFTVSIQLHPEVTISVPLRVAQE